MRLLQIQLNGTESGVLEFHPMLTVVSGLTPSARARVVQAFTALPRAGDPGCGGLLESYGVLLDLTPQNLALLGLSDVDLDVLVRADDIPLPDGFVATGSNGSSGDAGGSAWSGLADDPGPDAPLADVVPFDRAASRRPAEITPAWVIDHVEDGRFPALDAARAALASALEARAVFEGAIDKARAEHADTTASRERLESELEAAIAQLERLEAARAQLLGGGPPPEGGATGDPIDHPTDDAADLDLAVLRSRTEGLESRLRQIDRSLSELAAIDVKPIEVLLEAMRNPAPTVMMPSERANQLADIIVDLRRQLVVVESRLDAEGFSIARAEERLDAARAEVTAAERAIAKPRLSPEDIAELEAVHERVLDAEAKASGRLGGRGGRKKLEELLNEQQAILDRVGFPTWSAYVMGAGLLGIDPVAEQRLEQARAEVDQAEANWAVITETLEHDPEYRGLLDELESVYLEAFDLLGGDNGDEDLEVALRHLEVPVQEVTTDDLVAAMAYQFELIGLDLGPSPSLEVLEMAADALLSEAAAITGRIEELSEERRSVRAELSVTEQDLHHSELAADARAEARPAPAEPAEPVELATAADVEAAREAVAALDQQLEAARADESDYGDLVDARVALAEAAEGSVDTAERKLAAVAESVLDEVAAEEGAEAAPGTDAVEASGGDEVPEIEILEDPGAPDLDSPPLGASNRFLDILNDLPYGEELEDDQLLEQVADTDDELLAEAEFYLLARLAAQRNLSFAGSVPLLVDDALAVLDPDDRVHLLARLERMSSSVQIVYLTDDPVVRAWAEDVGSSRAAAVHAPRTSA